MIVEYIRYQMKDGQAAALEEAYTRAQKVLKNSPNCLGYELSRCHEEPNRYILRIVWDSLEGHMQKFRKDPSFKDFLQEIREFIPQIEEMQHYEVTSVHSG